MASEKFSLRVYSYLDRMQPEYAAFVGTITQGDLPTEGMASLYVEVRLVLPSSKMGRWCIRLMKQRAGRTSR